MPAILLFSINYWPEETGIGPYSTGLAEHLASAGHDVTVVAGMPHYPAWRVAPEYSGTWRSRERRHGVLILRRAHYVPRRQSALRRAIYEGTFLANAALSRTPRPDAVLGVVPSLGGAVAARMAAGRAKAGYGIVVQDLVSAAAVQSGIEGGSRVAAVIRLIESWALRHATVVSPVADAFRPGLAALGVDDDRVLPLPNWSHLSAPTGDREGTRQSLGWRRDEFVAVHTGNMGLKQGLDQIIEAGRIVEREGLPIRFVLIGDGSQRASLVAQAEGSTRLEIRSFVPHDDLPNVLAAADVLVLSERPSVVDMSLPSKLTSYFAAGRPVVAAVPGSGASAREVRLADGGVTTPAGEPAALVRAIADLRERPDEAQRLGENGRHYAETSLGRAAALERADVAVRRILDRTRDLRMPRPGP